MGVDEEAGFAFELLGGDNLSGLPSGERRFPVPDRDLTLEAFERPDRVKVWSLGEGGEVHAAGEIPVPDHFPLFP